MDRQLSPVIAIVIVVVAVAAIAFAGIRYFSGTRGGKMDPKAAEARALAQREQGLAARAMGGSGMGGSALGGSMYRGGSMPGGQR